MTHHDGQFQTGDGLTLHENRWLPEDRVRGVVAFVHGFTEHGGRYAGLAESLNRHGYAVAAMDLRGHGRSQGRPVYVRSFDHYLDDLDEWLARLRRDWPKRPIFLAGNSLGAAIVLLSAIEREPQVAGVVASGPPVRIGGAVFPMLRHLAVAFGQIFPRLRLVSMGSRMLSHDPQVEEDFRNDALIYHGRFPIRTGAEILRASRRIRRGMQSLQAPLLILHGGDDVITDPKGSRQLFAQAAAADKTLKIYDGLYHDLFHEIEKDKVTADLIDWLDARVERSTAAATAAKG